MCFSPCLQDRTTLKDLFNKGFTLGALGRSEEEVAAYEQVLARFADAPGPPWARRSNEPVAHSENPDAAPTRGDLMTLHVQARTSLGQGPGPSLA
jgi:hypothetical protein